MYATKPLSLFKSQPEASLEPPPEGRNSGYLVVKGAVDEETRFWGLLPDRRVRELPFPQDRVLKVRYTVGAGENRSTHEEAVVFVPVPDQPLASNRYYAVIAKGKRKGLVRACSREEDMATCCFCRCISDVAPRPFDPADVYQQVEIVQRRRGWFTARAVAADAFPSSTLRHKYWEVYASKSKKFDLGEALGLDAAALRTRQLAVADTFPVAATAAAVGKWYAPFYLVKEAGVTPREQMGRSASTRAAATGQMVGVCTSMWERMRWEQCRGGWVDEEEDAGKVAGGSVLAERFADVAFDFVHLNKVRANQL
uniref:Uncharacterized protein n=1 Tax=Setaria italica TaxID=4555 RepID=K3YKZ3_SETIT